MKSLENSHLTEVCNDAYRLVDYYFITFYIPFTSKASGWRKIQNQKMKPPKACFLHLNAPFCNAVIVNAQERLPPLRILGVTPGESRPPVPGQSQRAAQANLRGVVHALRHAVARRRADSSIHLVYPAGRRGSAVAINNAHN